MTVTCSTCGEPLIEPHPDGPDSAVRQAILGGVVYLLEREGERAVKRPFCNRQHLASWLSHPMNGPANGRPQLSVVR